METSEWSEEDRIEQIEWNIWNELEWQKNVQKVYVFFSKISNFPSSSSSEFQAEWIIINFIQKYSNKITFFLDFRMGL